MANISINVQRNQADDIVRICALGNEKIHNAYLLLAKHEKTVIGPTTLKSIFSEHLPSDEADLLTRQLMGLATFARVESASASEVITGLDSGLRSRENDNEKILLWEKCKPTFEKFLQLKSIYLSAKALSLNFDYTNFYGSAKIVSDIRPIFDDDRSEIMGAIVSQTLRLEFDSEGNQKNVSIAMDLDDIKKLRKSCDDAIKKIRAARALVLEQWNLELYEVVESNNDVS